MTYTLFIFGKRFYASHCYGDRDAALKAFDAVADRHFAFLYAGADLIKSKGVHQ